jgi:tetratricopeptide (TPR) repeat protein
MDADKWQQLMDRYAVTFAVVKRQEGIDYSSFFRAPRWSLVYQDGLTWVFVRNAPANAQIIERFGYLALRPNMSLDELAQEAGRSPQAVLRDLDRLDVSGLRDGMEHSFVAYGYLLLNRLDRAREILLRGQERFPRFAMTYYNLAVVEKKAGRVGEMRRDLQRFLELSDDAALKKTAREALAGIGG